MLRRHVLAFEHLHGGRCDDVRRFCNFMISEKSLLGGTSPDKKRSRTTDTSSDPSRDEGQGRLNTPTKPLTDSDQSPDRRPTPPTIRNGQTAEQYKEHHGQSPRKYTPSNTSRPPNTPDWEGYTTPPTVLNTPTQPNDIAQPTTLNRALLYPTSENELSSVESDDDDSSSAQTDEASTFADYARNIQKQIQNAKKRKAKTI